MKKIVYYLFLLCLILPAGLQCVSVRAAGSVPSVSAQAAVLIDQASGRILFSRNSSEKLPIASITKVMTAVLAIESGKLNRMVTVSREAVRAEGSSIYLKPGERIRLIDLVYGLMLRSGNDASVAIAEAVAGSTAGFALLMNEKAAELGMNGTHFMNPNGLDDPGHYSTAADMAVLTRYAMQNTTFRKITGTRSYRVEKTNKEQVRVLLNKNKMLRLYSKATGGKTGFTKKAGRTLISTASSGSVSLIVVTLNDGDDWRDHQQLFEWGFTNYHPVVVVHQGKLKANTVSFYRNRLYIRHNAVWPLTDQEAARVKRDLVLVAPTSGKEKQMPPEPAGYLKIRVAQEQLGSIPVYYKKAAEEKKSFWKLFTSLLTTLISGGAQSL
ncbi:D-alanyl-D-alanine carboxypeptidase family protein [Sporolactobacillus vineae]|uniref:D-alanyl-D-alanine carboxypeptidase family protein n=1 Tax=Sporolactobacillus vineae TaxID=444463 RepID=UPI00028A26E0|nr:D-alanyl-D-alanine carboxypeptidase family protein [Sporolactobacillus vineae]